MYILPFKFLLEGHFSLIHRSVLVLGAVLVRILQINKIGEKERFIRNCLTQLWRLRSLAICHL
jgi:hypothetical protein